MSLSQKDKELIDKYAKKIVNKGWGTAALLWFDGTSHLSNVVGHLLHVVNPTLMMIPYIKDIFKDSSKVAELLEERENVEYFLTRIEFFMNNNDKKKLKAPKYKKIVSKNDKNIEGDDK